MFDNVALIAEQLKSGLQLQGDLSISGPVYHSTNSIVYRGDGECFPFSVAIKRCLDLPQIGLDASEDCALQFNALNSVYQALPPNTKYAVPRPVGLLEEHALLVAEWIDGNSLTKMLRQPTVGTNTVLQGVEKAGEWLKAFHDAHRVPETTLDTVWALGLLGAALEETPDEFLHRHDVKSPVAFLHETVSGVKKISTPHSWVHGDYKSDNLMIVGERIYGLDAGANFENTVLLDVGYFLNHLALGIFDPRSWHLFLMHEHLAAVFIRGYGGLSIDVRRSLLWFRLLAALRLWAERQDTNSSIHSLYENFIFSRLVAKLKNDLSVASI
ncbi:MAG: hypothetical protein CMM52_15100 [Rhodospirillaceae bacterium]|nr:hypothetical protein [Rhodospirillaceae bacterium]|tara:strand:- start:20055 stop:21035 length:981 start_codon:yes stop_codon:yes gene_type:complete